MKLSFKSGTGQAMPHGLSSGAKTGQIVVNDVPTRVYRSLAEVEADVDRLKADLADILRAAQAHFGP